MSCKVFLLWKKKPFVYPVGATWSRVTSLKWCHLRKKPSRDRVMSNEVTGGRAAWSWKAEITLHIPAYRIHSNIWLHSSIAGNGRLHMNLSFRSFGGLLLFILLCVIFDSGTILNIFRKHHDAFNVTPALTQTPFTLAAFSSMYIRLIWVRCMFELRVLLPESFSIWITTMSPCQIRYGCWVIHI